MKRCQNNLVGRYMIISKIRVCFCPLCTFPLIRKSIEKILRIAIINLCYGKEGHRGNNSEYKKRRVGSM